MSHQRSAKLTWQEVDHLRDIWNNYVTNLRLEGYTEQQITTKKWQFCYYHALRLEVSDGTIDKVLTHKTWGDNVREDRPENVILMAQKDQKMA